MIGLFVAALLLVVALVGVMLWLFFLRERCPSASEKMAQKVQRTGYLALSMRVDVRVRFLREYFST